MTQQKNPDESIHIIFPFLEFEKPETPVKYFFLSHSKKRLNHTK